MCGAGKFCTRFNANPNGPLPADARLVGICVTRCDFWDPAACAAGTRCLTTPSIDGGQSLQDNGICIGTKGAKKGEPCAANADCDIGLGCGGDKLCGTYCDGAHPTCDPDTETCPSQVPSQVALCAPK